MAISLIPVCTLLKLDFGDNIGSEHTWVLNEVTTESSITSITSKCIHKSDYISSGIAFSWSYWTQNYNKNRNQNHVIFLDQTQTLKYRNQNYLTYDKTIQNSTVYSFFLEYSWAKHVICGVFYVRKYDINQMQHIRNAIWISFNKGCTC